MTSPVQPSAEATLFLQSTEDGGFAGLLADIDALLSSSPDPLRRIAARGDEFTLFERDGRRALVSLCPEPVATDTFATANRPEGAPDPSVHARLERHVACLSVSVRGREGRSASDDPETFRLCEDIVRRAMRRARPALVHWGQTDTIFTADEFRDPDAIVFPSRPAGRPAPRRTPRPTLLSGLDAPREAPHPVARVGLPAQPPVQRISARAPALRVARAHARAVFPPLEPADAENGDLVRTRRALFPDDGPQFGDRHAPAVQRITVYALNFSLMLVALPVGASVLTMNLLGGENMRLTSHALALSGMYLGIEAPSTISSLLHAFV